MVYTRPTAKVQREATSAAFRRYGINAALTPTFAALTQDLELVDVQSSSIRCQGACKKGGRCTQIINATQIARAVLQLKVVAVNEKISGAKLKKQLAAVYEELLCTSKDHCTEVQIEQSTSKAKGIVEAWREQRSDADASDTDDDEDDCENCASMESNLAAAMEDLDEMEGEIEVKSAQVKMLKRTVRSLAQERDAALDKVDELTLQLESLQMQQGLPSSTTALPGRHQRTTPNTFGSQRGITSASRFRSEGGRGEADQHRRTTCSKAHDFNVATDATPPTTPSSKTLSPSPVPEFTPITNISTAATTSASIRKAITDSGKYSSRRKPSASTSPFATIKDNHKPKMPSVTKTPLRGQRQPLGILTPNTTPSAPVGKRGKAPYGFRVRE